MCGISTVFRYGSISELDKVRMAAMNLEMHYRGPDDHGVWFDQKCGMAQVRLSIIGLEKGKQPLFNEDGSLVLICNGEIYNYVELQDILKAKGHILQSDSDSEVILHLYEEYGTKCLDYLRGMFAFALWDGKTQQLMVARDRIGEKPIYYAEIPNGIVFSSELKAILKNYIDRPQLNLEQLAAPIRYTSPLDKSHTLIDQIKKMEPGHFFLVDDKGVQKKQYWYRNTKVQYFGSFENAKGRALELLQESVNLCMRSDVPVAVMLSGGIDSSAIAALAKRAGREVYSVTAGYKGKHNVDERQMARRFAKDTGVIYQEVELVEQDFRDCFEELAEYLDEPITDAGAIAQWALYKKVKQLGFKVLLGGLGGDELFYGYPYWNDLAKSLAITHEHQAYFPWHGLGKKMSFLKFTLRNWKYILYGGYPLGIADSSVCFWQYEDFKTFSKDATINWKGELLHFDSISINKFFGECKPGEELDLVYNFSFDNIMTMAYLYLTDRLGMGNSLEIRSPFLDYKLVEFVSGLPQSLKYREGQPKYFLKQVLKDIIPDYILNGEKKGFAPPSQFIKNIIIQNNYKVFSSTHKYYNSMLADKVLYNLIKTFK